MNSMIEELYDAFPPKRWDDPERRRAAEECHELREKIEAVFGPEFVDRFAEVNERRLGYDGLGDFAAGFRLGGRLMVEAFKPV